MSGAAGDMRAIRAEHYSSGIYQALSHSLKVSWISSNSKLCRRHPDKVGGWFLVSGGVLFDTV